MDLQALCAAEGSHCFRFVPPKNFGVVLYVLLTPSFNSDIVMKYHAQCEQLFILLYKCTYLLTYLPVNNSSSGTTSNDNVYFAMCYRSTVTKAMLLLMHQNHQCWCYDSLFVNLRADQQPINNVCLTSDWSHSRSCGLQTAASSACDGSSMRPSSCVRYTGRASSAGRAERRHCVPGLRFVCSSGRSCLLSRCHSLGRTSPVDEQLLGQ